MVSFIREKFLSIFDENPQLIIASPGRINIIGEHTDYNEGFVLPAAIDKAVYFGVSLSKDESCHFYALDINEDFETSVQKITHTSDKSWANYLMGVINEVQLQSGILPKGINIIFSSTLPSGAGMSSSAAIENGIAIALNELFGLKMSPLDMVQLSQRAENNFVGMKCGVMDMFASMMGQAQQVIRIDCRDFSYEYYPFISDDLAFVLCNTGIKHALVDSEYNTRRAECEEGIKVLQNIGFSIHSLRDTNMEELREHQAEFRPVVWLRCKYVVEEIIRVEEACEALKNNDFVRLGKLMFTTHEGLSNEYEVSCKELDFLVTEAQKYPEVFGSRMMGGGFGGCTINLIEKKAIPTFLEKIGAAYEKEFQIKMEAYIASPSQGTRIIEAGV